MKLSALWHSRGMLAAGLLVFFGLCGGRAEAAGVFDNFSFAMVPTGGTEACIPKATGVVTISPLFGQVESMTVDVSGLPPDTDFDLFVIQVPTAPFGLAWYMGDMLTDSRGRAVQVFEGRFSIGTFIVAPGVAPAPVVLKGDAAKNPATPPVQLYHLGLWFDSPADAGKAGCGTVVTPFNSTHDAGVQVMNTSNFKTLFGPLRSVVDR